MTTPVVRSHYSGVWKRQAVGAFAEALFQKAAVGHKPVRVAAVDSVRDLVQLLVKKLELLSFEAELALP